MDMDREADVGRTIGDIEGHVAALLCYLLGWICGLVVFLAEPKNPFVRFHAMQTMLLAAATVVYAIPVAILSVLTCGIGSALGIVPLVFRIIAAVKAAQRRYYKIPLIGDLAERWSKPAI